MTKQITINQHFAPKLYFKNFADNNFLQTLDLKAGKILKPKPYAGVCYAKFYYALDTGTRDQVSQEFEEFFNAIETHYAEHYSSIVDNILKYRQLTYEQLDALAWFVSCLWIRSPQMRDRMNDMMEDSMKWFMEFTASHPSFIEHSKKALEEEGHKVTTEQAEEVAKTFVDGKYSIDFDNQTHLNFITKCQEFRNWFFAKNWRFYIAKPNKHFVTSDTSVIEIFNDGTFAEKMYKNHIMQRKQFFALNPNILVELVDPLRYQKKEKKVKWCVISDEQVVQYNLLRTQYSDNYCYSKDRSDLEDLLPYYQG
jgi:hypothetical protein